MISKRFTEEVYDIRSNTKLYPIAYFPDYLISKSGIILNTMNMQDEQPIEYSKKDGYIYNILNYNGKYEKRSLARLMCDTFYARSQYPIVFKVDNKSFDFDDIYLSTAGCSIKEYDGYIMIDDEKFMKLEETEIYINSNGLCINMSNKYNLFKDKFLKCVIKKGYYLLPILRIKYGLSDRLHRACYLAWNKVIPDSMTIDHLNGFKWDNSISNFECVSSAENVSRANAKHYLSNENQDIRELILNIADDIMNGMKYKLISEKYNVPHSLIINIARKASYSDITKDYDFQLKGGYISKETAKKAIEMMNNGESNRNIAKQLDIDVDRVKRIRKGGCFVSIPRNYEPSKYWLLSKSEITDIKYNLIPSGMSIADIARKYDVSWCTIRDIRDGKTYTEV